MFEGIQSFNAAYTAITDITAETKQKDNHLKCGTYNVDGAVGRLHFAQLKKGTATEVVLPHLLLTERKAKLVKALEASIDQGVDVYSIQECRLYKDSNGQTFNLSDELASVFKNKGYEVVLKPYNETGYIPDTQNPNKEDMRMFYMTAYKPGSLSKFDEQMVYFTKSPYKDAFDNYKKGDGTEMTIEEKKTFNYGEAFCRGCLRIGFGTENGNLLFVYNLHSPLFGTSKEKSSKIVAKDIEELQKLVPDAQFIINGDLNTFAEKGGDKHMEPFKKLMRFRDVSSDLINTATGKPVAATFTPASNDFGRFSGYRAIKTLEGEVCKEPDPGKRSNLIGQMIKCAYFLALMEQTWTESRQRTPAEKNDMNNTALAMANSPSPVKDLIANRLKLSPEKANKLLAESGYSVSGRAMDHGILIGDRLEQNGQAISNPHFTDNEYWKGKDLTPLEWLDYALEMNKARTPNGASDHHELIFGVTIKGQKLSERGARAQQ